MQKIRKAVIPAAGLGTRFLPATKAMAKEMMPVVDTPSIQFVVKEALKSGIEEILIITGKGKNAIEDHFDANSSLENNLIEKGKDDLLEKVQSTTIQIPKEKSNRFGVIDIQDEIEPHLYNTKHFVEKPLPEQAPSTLGIVGRYVLPAEIFTILENQEPDQGGEIQLTDALETLNKQNSLLAYEYTGTRYDVGDKYGMLVANIEIGLKNDETSAKLKDHIKKLANKLK